MAALKTKAALLLITYETIYLSKVHSKIYPSASVPSEAGNRPSANKYRPCPETSSSPWPNIDKSMQAWSQSLRFNGMCRRPHFRLCFCLRGSYTWRRSHRRSHWRSWCRHPHHVILPIWAVWRAIWLLKIRVIIKFHV